QRHREILHGAWTELAVPELACFTDSLPICRQIGIDASALDRSNRFHNLPQMHLDTANDSLSDTRRSLDRSPVTAPANAGADDVQVIIERNSANHGRALRRTPQSLLM